MKTGQAFGWTNSHVALLADDGVLSVRCLARAFAAQWCEMARLATVATVSIKCATQWRSCEMRGMIMNKRGNLCCWLGSKPLNNKRTIMAQTDTLKYACCHGNHALGFGTFFFTAAYAETCFTIFMGTFERVPYSKTKANDLKASRKTFPFLES